MQRWLNPNRLFKRPQATPRNSLARELEGYTELGMREEALGLSRQLLAQDHVTAEAFHAALNAVLTHAERVKSWRRLVESAYRRLSIKAKNKARFLMLSFYCGLGNSRGAAAFLPRRFTGPLALVEMLFALEIMMALDRMDEAKTLALQCVHGLEVAGNPEMKQLFMHQLAAYFARTREWSAAVVLWEALLTSDLCVEEAIRGLVNVGLAHSLDAITRGITAVQTQKNARAPAMPRRVPRNGPPDWDAIERFLKHTCVSSASQSRRFSRNTRWRSPTG